MADKSIGKLTLDISDVEKKINSVNEFLGKIGANVNLEDKLSKKISEALNKLVAEAKKAGQEAQKAIEQATGGNGSGTSKSNDGIKEAIKLWKEYYTVLRQAETAYQGGNAARAQELRNEAEAIKQRAEALRKEADVEKEIAAAKRQYETAYSNTGNKDRLNQIKEEVKAQQELAKAVKDVQEMKRKTDQQILSQSAKNEQEQLDHLINLYVKYFEYKTKAVNAESSGNKAGTDMFNGLAQNIQQQIADLTQYNQELKVTAENSEKVVNAQVAWQTAITASSSKEASASMKENEASVKEYANALVALYNEQTRLNNAVASGKIVEGSAEYDAATEKINHLEQAVVKAGEKLDEAGIKAANGMQSVQTAADNLVQSQARMSDSSEVDALARITDAYNNLKNAINQYNIAKKSSNEQGMNYWQGEIDSQMAIVYAIQQAVNSLNLEADVRDRINQKIQESITLNDGFQKGMIGGAQGASELEMQLTGIATRLLSIMAVWRAISNIVQNMVEYVSEYSDKMNEIQIITQKSNAEVEQLSETYKNIAEMMNVSTLDIAEAAVYFTRQGLPAEEIEQRLKNVTMYAKTANVEFKESSEIITAVVNSMNLMEQEAEDGRNATQRVADVFLKVGDSAATSGEEIGRAMQKAAASAGAFGVSFEWLSSAIATVSETTRQEARTIGTAFNTIIARLHQIKTTGYNQEDETKINDVAKALAKIDVALMDQYGNWRDMEDVWNDVAAKWGELDGKTKSYIATTMAGVKQQNVFLAAMNDMSKTIEEGGRFWELYALAMDSAGTAEEKYATWTDSVAASQERLNLAQEKFYSILGSNVIKGWNDMLANFVNMIAEGAEAWNSWNIIIPVVSGAVLGLVVALNAAKLAATTTFAVIGKHPVIAGIVTMIGVVGTLITMFSAAASEVETTAEKLEKANNTIRESSDRINSLSALSSKANEMFANIGDETSYAGGELEEYNGLLEELSKTSPAVSKALDDMKNGFISQGEAAKIVNEELERQIELQKKIALAALRDKYANTNPTEEKQSIYDEMRTWDSSVFESSKSFGAWIKKLYGANIGNGGYVSALREYHFLSRDMIKFISDEYYKLEDSISEDDRWEIVGQRLWEKYLAGFELSKNATQDAMTSDVNAIIDDLYNVASVGLSEVDAGIMREKLIYMLIGPDEIATTNEWKNASTRAAKIAIQMLTDGFEITAADELRHIGKSIYGDMFSQMFSDEEVNQFAEDYPWIVEQIKSAYEELLAAGFAGIDIEAIMDENFKLYQWAGMAEQMKRNIRDALAEAYSDDEGNDLISSLFGDDWEELDFEALALLNDLAQLEVGINEIENAAEGTHDLEEFLERLRKIRESKTPKGEDGLVTTTEEINEIIKSIKDLKKEYDEIDKVLSGFKNDEDTDIQDMLGLAELHPELMAVSNDIIAFEKALNDLKRSKGEEVVGKIRDMLQTNEEIMKNSPFADFISDEVRTLGDLIKDPGMYDSVQEYIDQCVAMILAASGNLEMAGKEWAVSFMNGLFSNANMDLSNRPVIDASELTKAGWDNAGNGIATLFSSTYTAGGEGLEWNQDIVVALTPITKDGKVLSPDKLDAYMEDLLTDTTDMSGILEKDKNGLGLVIDVSAVADGDFEGATNKMNAFLRLLHLIHDYLYDGIEGESENESWLSQQVRKVTETMNNDWAKNNGYIEQINALSNALAEGGTEGVQTAMDMWNSYNEEMRKAILQTYPELGQALLEAEQAIDKQTGSEEKAIAVTDKLGKSLDKAAKYASAKNFKSTYDAIQKLQKGTISATDAYEEFNKELKNIESAQEDVADVQEKMANNTEITTDDVTNLAKALGVTAQQVIDDFPGALEMFEELKQAGMEAFNELNREATMKILGISEADFSNIKNGLIAVQSDAKATIEMLKATGQWELVTEDLPADMPVFDVVNGQTTKVGTIKATGHQTLLRMKDSNPFAGISGGKSSESKSKKGGGGGGGGGNTNQMTEVERMLDNMSQINDIQKYQQSYYQAQNKYYEQTGQLQGVIAYSEREIDVLNEQTRALEGNVAKIEEYIDKKKAELSALSTGDAAYEEVADDLDKLQKAHQEYTNQLIENKTAVDQLTKAIEEQQNKIREMEINLRNTILNAIKDREKRTENMLNAEIDMENTILDLIQKRYEKERDQIIETTNKKIDALNKERELLDEQLRIRKEQEEAEEKAVKLRELEMKYQRIISDPTRRKEAQSIKSEIDSLRKEMAWDLAEEEVKAQQDSIDQQITSLEDYMEYIQNYYEDMFEHPQQLIEEMHALMKQTDADIIEWLKTNDEEYAKSTENTQKKMVNGWQDTLDAIKDIIKTYWDEVEWIIEQGDDYIVEFLKQNSEDYREAGRLQAEAYVDEWMEQLDNLKKAYQSVVAEAAAAYSTIEKSSGSSKSSGGGGGGSSKKKSETEDHGYSFKYGGKEYVASGFATTAAAEKAMKDAVTNIIRVGAGTLASSSMIGQGIQLVQNAAKVYAKGGLADYTGYAWVDGSKENPERVLTPYQTKMFETMVAALESISRISVPGMMNPGDINMTGGNPVSVGDIIVNVENLDTDDDYEELADKVSEVLMDRIGKTTAIGGLRIRSV